MAKSLTETQNPLTLGIDMADPKGMVRLLRQSDMQLFAGWDTWPGLPDEEMLETLARLGFSMAALLRDPRARIVFSGAGTSGRFSHLLALEFNRVLRERRLPEVFTYTIAGGEAALIAAQEAAEDNPVAGVRDLKAVLPNDLTHGLYIGITAGISAPYVAGQLEHALADERFHTAIVGFNPPELARDRPVEGWDKTVRQVLQAALESPRFILVNPIYGPEAITGSTRMKGGSMTKIAIEIAFAIALDLIGGDPAFREVSQTNLFPLRARVRHYIRRFRDAVDAAYGNVEALGGLVRLAGTALRSGGRIHYLGRGVAGIMGIIDASECPPTFGANPNDVRAYLREGWELMGFNSAAMRARGKAYEIGHDYFEASVLPELSRGDLVVGIAVQTLGENTARLLEEAAKLKANTALLLVTTQPPVALPDSIRHLCLIEVPSCGFFAGLQNEAELALKLCLNATTTGAHIMAGKIFNNVMIDLRISNAKLYDRAVGLVAGLARVTPDVARAALHHAMFRRPQTAEEIAATPVTACISRAMARERTVPLATLLATGRFTLEEAEERLAAEPRVRRLIEEVIGGSTPGTAVD
jgi:N-acetylmuramic acid 6-phosphate (MurNAc-6-P) etherase